MAMPVAGHASTVLGLDLERIVPPGTAQQIASGVMPERSPGGSGMTLAEEITRVFSAKEALCEALFPHTRQFREFSAASIDWHRDGPGDPVRVR